MIDFQKGLLQIVIYLIQEKRKKNQKNSPVEERLGVSLGVVGEFGGLL